MCLTVRFAAYLGVFWLRGLLEVSEFELVDLIQAHYDRIWVVIQFWGGVSLALIGASYFIAEKLNLALLAALIALYTTFSIFTFGTISSDTQLANEYLADIAALEIDGVELAAGTQLLLTQSGVTGIAEVVSLVAFLSTYLAAVGYAIYSYRLNKGDAT